MDKIDLTNELLKLNSDDICDILVRLMANGHLNVTTVIKSYIHYLDQEIYKRDKLLQEADDRIFESVFADSIGKVSDVSEIHKKIQWLEKHGGHNIEGILKRFTNKK